MGSGNALVIREKERGANTKMHKYIQIMRLNRPSITLRLNRTSNVSSIEHYWKLEINFNYCIVAILAKYEISEKCITLYLNLTILICTKQLFITTIV